MSTFSVTPNGVITVDTMDVLAQYQDAYKAALGSDLNLDASTPQGQLITNDTNNHSVLQAEIVNAINNYSVFYATKRALDVAGSRYGYYRKSGVATVVVATVAGTQGTIIPSGAKASDGTHEYALLNTTTIPAGGSTTAQFQCTEVGAIYCPVGTLTEIVTPVAGWEAISNVNDGVAGYADETDSTFRQRIVANMLQKRGRSTLGALLDNLAALPDVISVVGRENPTDNTVTIDTVTMEPHSIYVCILGGSSDGIARTMAQQKTMGAATVGNTVVTFRDDDTGYAYQYNIQRPTDIALYVKVQYKDNLYSPIQSTVKAQIQSVLQEYVAAHPFMIGQTISGPDLAAAFADFTMADVISISIGTENTTTPASATGTQTVGSSLSDIAVDADTFGTQISADGSYAFVFDGNDWTRGGNTVDMADYGITFTGTPVLDDEITVAYTAAETTYAQYQATTIQEVAILSTDNITVEKV